MGLMVNRTSAKNSTIGQLHELDTEMLEISKQFASQTAVIVADQITRLGVIVLKKLEQVCDDCKCG